LAVWLNHTKCKQVINSSNYYSYIKTSNVGDMLCADRADPHTKNTFESQDSTHEKHPR